MKKFFTIFFVTLGVIFSIIILIGIYLFIADPFNIKPLIFGGKTNTSQNTGTTTQTSAGLSDSQKKALEAVGVNPATITPAQEACFTAKLGAARVAEIKAGSTPTAVEIFTAKSCI